MDEESVPQYRRARTLETNAVLSAPTEELWRIHDNFSAGEQKETAVTTTSIATTSHTSWAVEKLSFGIGSKPSLRSRASSLRSLSADQAFWTDISGWLSYWIPSPRSMTTMFIRASAMRLVRSTNVGCAGVRSTNKPSKKGTGFQQPQKPHEHWHIDISYINIHGTFYYLTTILDGYSRYVAHWEIRRSMTEQDELVVLQRAKEKYPHETPRIISDNGSQFLAKDFKEFIRICGMTHVRTSPYYPQSNGKLERFHGSIKGECLRPGTPISLEDAIRIVARYVEHYNEVRLHSAIGYVAPADKLAGRETEIFAARDSKLAEARERRKEQREMARLQTVA